MMTLAETILSQSFVTFDIRPGSLWRLTEPYQMFAYGVTPVAGPKDGKEHVAYSAGLVIKPGETFLFLSKGAMSINDRYTIFSTHADADIFENPAYYETVAVLKILVQEKIMCVFYNDYGHWWSDETHLVEIRPEDNIV